MGDAIDRYIRERFPNKLVLIVRPTSIGGTRYCMVCGHMMAYLDADGVCRPCLRPGIPDPPQAPQPPPPPMLYQAAPRSVLLSRGVQPR